MSRRLVVIQPDVIPDPDAWLTGTGHVMKSHQKELRARAEASGFKTTPTDLFILELHPIQLNQAHPRLDRHDVLMFLPILRNS